MTQHLHQGSTMNLPRDDRKDKQVDKFNAYRMARAIRRSNRTDAQKVVLESIADHASGGNGVCTAVNATLAEETGKSERQITRMIDGFKDDTSIEIIRTSESKFSKRSMRIGPRLIDEYHALYRLEKERRESRAPRQSYVQVHATAHLDTAMSGRSEMHLDISDGAPRQNGPVHLDTAMSSAPRQSYVHQTSPITTKKNNNNERGEWLLFLNSLGEEEAQKMEDLVHDLGDKVVKEGYEDVGDHNTAVAMIQRLEINYPGKLCYLPWAMEEARNRPKKKDGNKPVKKFSYVQGIFRNRKRDGWPSLPSSNGKPQPKFEFDYEEYEATKAKIEAQRLEKERLKQERRRNSTYEPLNGAP